MRTSIQIALIRDPDDRATDVYADTLKLAFQGSSVKDRSANAYLDDAVDLRIRVLELTDGMDDEDIQRLLSGARNTIVVVIGELHDQTDKLKEELEKENFVYVASPVRHSNVDVQGEKASDGVEPALAPVATALRAMQRARYVLQRDINDGKDSETSLKLFISHAKVDGVAMARSLIALLRQLRELDDENLGIDYFYDDEHIEPGTLWREVLDAEAKQSVLIALRTEEFENRVWCSREFLSAESNCMPIIAVDLRKAQYHDCGLLPFDLVPTVRVADGNLIRVVLHAMAAHLRMLRLEGQVSDDVRVLPHRPSVYSLHTILQTETAIEKIAYPGSRLPPVFKTAVAPILKQGKIPVNLVTYDDLGRN